MDSTMPHGDLTSANSVDGPLCVQVRCRHGRKRLRGNPYPKWTFDSEHDGHAHALLDRLALVQLSLRCYSRPLVQLSPISRLPSEILALIFLHAIQVPSTNNVLPCQFVIASVCRTWRTVAFSTPEYWGTLYVPPLMPVNIFQSLLTRSSPFPLSVEFFRWRPFKRKQYVSSNEPILERLLDMLRPETYRLWSLTIQGRNCSWSAQGLVRSWEYKYLVNSLESDSSQSSDMDDW